MVPWPLKVALAVGLLTGVAVELGRPAAARLELNDVARDAADAAQDELADHDRRTSLQEARDVVESRGAQLIGFDVEGDGRVTVRVARHVEPIVLDDLKALRGWYDVEMGATSDGLPGS